MQDFDTKTFKSETLQFLSGGGEMGALIRAKDWSKTLVGEPSTWPQSLRTTLSIILNSKFPMFLFWGPDLVCFYNDAYRPSLGKDGKHPGILGSRGEDYWKEIWKDIKPIIDRVLSGGEANWNEDMLLPIYRNGKMEDVYWTFSYSPVKDESGTTAGVFVTCTETTEKVLNFNELTESRNQLQFAIDSADLAAWTIDPVTNRFNGNSRLKEWHSLPPGEEFSLEKGFSVVKDEDREPLIKAIEKALDFSSGGSLDHEYTIIHPVTKQMRIVRAKGKTIFAPGKTPLRMSGILIDVTESAIAKKKAEESEQRFEAAIAAVNGILWTNNAAGEMVGEQPGWAALTGQTYEEYQGYGWADAIHPDDAQPTIDAWNEALKKKETFFFEHRIFMKNGHWGHFHIRAIPLLNSDGSIKEWVGVHTDITDMRRYEIALQQSERNLRLTILQASVAIAILRGNDYVVEIANDKALALWGRENEEVINRPIMESMPELVPQGIKELLDDVYLNGNTFSATELPVKILRKGKIETAYVNFVYEPLYDSEGKINGVMTVGTDVSEQVLARHRAEESESRFRSIVMYSPVGKAIVRGKDYIIELANPVMIENIWRKKSDEVIGKKLLEVFPELKQQKYIKLLDEVFESGETHKEIESVAYIHGRDGLKKFYLDFQYTPLMEADGNISAIMISFIDVTEKVEARQKIEDSEERLNIVIDAGELGTWELNFKTDEAKFSKRFYEIFGYKQEDNILHSQILEHIHPDDLLVRNNAIEEGLHTGIVHYEIRIVWNDGSIHWIEAKGKVFYDEENEPLKLLGTIRDTTDEKNYQQILLLREEKFRLLADSMPQFIWTGDAEGNLNYFNQSVYDYSGLTVQDMDAGGWIQIVHPDEKEENIKAWTKSVTTGEDFLFEHRFRRYDGEYRWQLSRAIPQRDAKGKIQMWVGTSTDIQEMKEQDQQKDYFISLASHELKTPITSIKAYTQILQSTYANSEDPFLVKSLSIIDKQIIKLTSLISDLLDISKIKSGSLTLHKENFEITELIQEIIDEIKHISPEFNINFSKAVMTTLYADRERIGQVITNLLTNAVKYSPHSGVIEVECVVENNNLIVSVEDFGIGIDKSDQQKIFERFYRVEGKSEKTFPGFGIGLFISTEIIRRHNGKIGVNSEPGKGSVFYFSIPLTR